MLHAQLTKIAEQLRRVVASRRVLVNKESFLAFVCGAGANPENPGARDTFLEYARRHIADIEFFLAEDYFAVHDGRLANDLLSMENEIAEYADCLIIFMESESALTELGAFCNSRELARIILAVNDKAHEHSQSFISLGPIAMLNRVSKFRPVLHSSLSMVTKDANKIEARLRSAHSQRATKFGISDKRQFELAAKKLRLLFLYELIALFGPLTHQELISVLEISLNGGGFEIRTELAMLRTLELVTQESNLYFHSPAKLQRFLRFRGMDVNRARASVLRAYHKAYRGRMDLLSRFANRESSWVS
jgi:hypothetical protein